ncbi:MAG: hypothetical protein JNG83_04940 [Opitutaceae bacterium]|nr:hypothetical protein [Opitutaceae bacterium]
MKSPLRSLTASLALLLATATPLLVHAAEADGAKPPPHERGPGGRGPNLEQLAADLGLSADQKAKLGPMLKQQAEQLRALRDDATLTREQRMEKAQAIRAEGGKAIKAILTPEQAAKFDEMRPRGPRGDRPGRPGKPDAN